MNRSAQADVATFVICFEDNAWLVQAHWVDGRIGPTITFKNESEARMWITRDAPAWARRFVSIENGLLEPVRRNREHAGD